MGDRHHVRDCDGSGAHAAADEVWIAVCQNVDTDDTGDICDTSSGSPWQCDTYTAVNTEAFNTGISATGGVSDWNKFRFEQEPGAASIRFFANGSLVHTFTTNIPDGTTDLWTGLSGFTETNTTADARLYVADFRGCWDD